MMHLNDLDTPTLVLDLDRVEANISQMQAYCDAHGLALRPHIKTHKIPALSHAQIRAGARGIACQKLGEAEVMTSAGIDDILLPYNILGRPKLERLARLSREARISVSVDSAFVAREMSRVLAAHGASVRVFVELGSTQERAGVTAVGAVVELARLIADLPALDYQGVLMYPTDSANAPFLDTVCRALEASGLRPPVVSGGGSPTAFQQHEVPWLTEVRVGTYIFQDMTGVRAGYYNLDNCAATLLCTIVSAPTPHRVILDGGSKTLTTEGGSPYGLIREYPDAQIYALNEEHAYVDVSACPTKPLLGERVHVIPNHVCVAVNLHNTAVAVRGTEVAAIWPIAARGLVQ
jgi:D-serine deaminase-like pyridoxal phosphate-dependent protein